MPAPDAVDPLQRGSVPEVPPGCLRVGLPADRSRSPDRRPGAHQATDQPRPDPAGPCAACSVPTVRRNHVPTEAPAKKPDAKAAAAPPQPFMVGVYANEQNDYDEVVTM